MGCPRPNVPNLNAKHWGDLHPVLRDRLWTARLDAHKQRLSLELNSGGRSDGQQWDLRRGRVPRGQECNPAYKASPLTAVPGRSNHRNLSYEISAADMMGTGLGWLNRNARTYGLHFPVRGDHEPDRGLLRHVDRRHDRHPVGLPHHDQRLRWRPQRRCHRLARHRLPVDRMGPNIDYCWRRVAYLGAGQQRCGNRRYPPRRFPPHPLHRLTPQLKEQSMNREPALIIAAIAALINVAVGFGLNWTAEQVTLVNVAVVALAAVVTRSKVTPA